MSLLSRRALVIISRTTTNANDAVIVGQCRKTTPVSISSFFSTMNAPDAPDAANTTKTQQFKSRSSSSSSSSSTMEEQKQKLARAAIKQVPKYGWTQDAITAAVMEEKMAITMSGMLTPTDLVNWLMDDFNQQLSLQQQQQQQEESNIATTTTTVFEKIQWRLEQVIPLVQSGQWQNGMAIGLLSTPWTTRSQLHDFIELIAPPGSSTMYKTGLGGIFVATELHMLSDTSPNYQDTWEFLRLRLQELDNGEMNNIGSSGSAAAVASAALAAASSSIPLAATSAVATSLLEGLASLVTPTSPMVGTRTTDYSPKK